MIAAACVALSACAVPPPPRAVVEVPESARIVAARAAIGEPAAAVAAGVEQVAIDLDDLRHGVERGAPMARGADLLRGALADVESDVAALRAATATLLPPGTSTTAPGAAAGRLAVLEAVAAADELAAAADATVAAAADELRVVDRTVAFDRALDGVVGGWDAPGSQSERRDALTRLAARAEVLRRLAARLPAVPPECTGHRDARVRWSATVAERSLALAALATGSAGGDYDVLRARYRRAPYGEDRLAADAADRVCWERRSAVLAAVGTVEVAVNAVVAALDAS